MIAKHCVIMDASLFNSIKAATNCIERDAILIDEGHHCYASIKLLECVAELKEMLSFVED